MNKQPNTIDADNFISSPSQQERKSVLLQGRLQDEELRKLKIENDIKEENKIIRRLLIIFLSLLTIGWLIFTGYEIRQIAKIHHLLPTSVAISFITSSLATVVGLWAIGLNYFFHKN